MVQNQVARCHVYEGIAWASAGACMVQGICESHIRLLATPVARAYGPPRREHMAVFQAMLWDCYHWVDLGLCTYAQVSQYTPLLACSSGSNLAGFGNIFGNQFWQLLELPNLVTPRSTIIYTWRKLAEVGSSAWALARLKNCQI